MSTFFWSAVVQGISEAFPISSHAHLVFFSHEIGWKMGAGAGAALHLGSWLALCVILRQEVRMMFQGFWDFFQGRSTKERRFFSLMVLSTLPVVLVGWMLHMTQSTGLFQDPRIIGGMTILFGIFLYGADRWNPHKNHTLLGLPYGAGLWIGLFQSLALVPGVSRLGICMTAGRLLGYSLPTATRFGLLLGLFSLPAAFVLERTAMMGLPFASLVTMVSVTFTLTLFCLIFFLFWVRRFPLWPVILYRILMGILLLWKMVR